jgi:hypothetical protein
MYQIMAEMDVAQFLINTLDKRHCGPWKTVLLHKELCVLFKKSHTESLPVIARLGFNLITHGASLRLRRVPWLVYGVVKALLIFFYYRQLALRQPPHAA